MPAISATFAQATNVHAGIIISSSGFNLRDSNILIKALVQELVRIENFFSNLLLSKFSTFSQTGPEVK